MLGGRPATMVAREMVSGRNYAALWRMWRLYPRFRENLGRYFLRRGAYPYRCAVRTPVGVVAPTLFSPDDMWTVNEVFCRRDYGPGAGLDTVVDIGSNIGISGLFFLSHSPGSRCRLFEPVPENVERLRLNLANYEGRYTVQQVAVAGRAGRARFGTEPTGRYGGIGRSLDGSIEVECVGINDVLEEALAEAPSVDILKIDTEGTELEILRAIRPDLLRRVRTIYAEVDQRKAFTPEGFEAGFHNETLVLRRLSP